MNTKRFLFIITILVILVVVLVVLVLRNTNQAVPINTVEIPQQTSLQENTPPNVPLSAGEHIVWENNNSFVTYNENALPNQRIVTINNIKKTEGGYVLTVSDFMPGSNGDVSDDGTVDKGIAPELVPVALRGQSEIFIADAFSIKYISYKDNEGQVMIPITSADFLVHFNNDMCFKDQYGCDNLRNVFWNIKMGLQGGVDSIQQEYQQ